MTNAPATHIYTASFLSCIHASEVGADVQVSFRLLGVEACLSSCRKPGYTAGLLGRSRLRKEHQL